MGTRSRVILYRNTKPHIYLWMHWDGYLSGQGSEFCRQIAALLSEFSIQELCDMLEALDIQQFPENTYKCFSAEKLTDFLKGAEIFYNDMCDDIEYEYAIDFARQLLTVKRDWKKFVTNFTTIQSGFLLGDVEDDWDQN